MSPSQDARLQFSPRCFPCRYAKVRAQATAKHEERILVDANVTLDELRSALTCAVHAFVLEILSAETLVKRWRLCICWAAVPRVGKMFRSQLLRLIVSFSCHMRLWGAIEGAKVLKMVIHNDLGANDVECNCCTAHVNACIPELRGIREKKSQARNGWMATEIVYQSDYYYVTLQGFSSIQTKSSARRDLLARVSSSAANLRLSRLSMR